MLTPISAISAADVSFQSPDLRQENAQPSAIPVASVPPEPETAANFVGAAVRAASGEFQLSQNVSILAGALGKLLDVHRLDNETSEAYVNRLVAVMQTMPAEQKALLEQQLGNLIKGLTFAILLDALKNSAGPEAARLSVVFELMQESEAHHTSRPAYLQDLAASTAPLPSAAPGNLPNRQATVNSGIVLPVPADPEANIEPAQQPLPTANKAPSEKAATDLLIKVPTALAAPLASPEQQVAAQKASPQIDPARLSPPNTPATMEQHPADGAQKTRIAARPSSEQAPTQLAGTTVVTEKQIPAPEAATVETDGLEQVKPNAFSGAPVLNPQMSGYDPAIIRQQFMGASPTQIEKLLLSVLMGTLTSPAEEASTPVNLPPAPAPTSPAEALQKSPAMPQTAAAKADGYPSHHQQNLENEVALQSAHRAAVAADIRSALVDTPALQSMVAATITKEGIPLPFVNYPPEKDEHESDAPPRGRWPSSSGEDASPEDQHEQPHEEETLEEERVAANDAEDDISPSEDAGEEGHVSDAEFYYLKMSNFS